MSIFQRDQENICVHKVVCCFSMFALFGESEKALSCIIGLWLLEGDFALSEVIGIPFVT